MGKGKERIDQSGRPDGEFEGQTERKLARIGQAIGAGSDKRL